MAANEAATQANTAPSRPLIRPPQLRTESQPLQARETSLLDAPAPTNTTASEDRARGVLIGESTPQQRVPDLLADPHAKSVDAVIGEQMPGSVVLQCQVGERRVDIRLPTSLVPPDLLQYGMPVRLSLRTDRGVRFPVIEPRKVRALPALDGEEEMDRWLASRN